jgi:hypothetical protein
MCLLITNAYFPPCDFGWGYMRLAEQAAAQVHAWPNACCARSR